MVEPILDRFEQHGPLTQVREGMDVYDCAERKVGTVKTIYLGNSSATARARGQAPATTGSQGDRDDSLIAELAEVFAPQDRLPEAIRGRLLREGYVAIDGGFLAGDRFATADQIGSVREDHVVLTVAEDGLIKQ